MKTTSQILLLATLAGIWPLTAGAQNSNDQTDKDLITEATLHRPAHSSNQTVNFDARVNLDRTESVSIDLSFNPGTGRVRIEAPNGGTINNGLGVATIDLAKQGKNHRIGFTTGKNLGRYTIEISRGNVTKTMEFWVGPEPPSGKPGPALTFTGGR